MATQTKHTPGPWYPPKNPTRMEPIPIYADGNIVATVIDKANVPIIASAPVLLEALEGMMHHHDHDPVGHPQLFCAQCQFAIAAIQKATRAG